MQTLVFNTTTKTIKLYEGFTNLGRILTELNNVPTVKVMEGFYEVRQTDGFEKQIPVLRLPISHTNMFIEK
jgi:hypothetical protein